MVFQIKIAKKNHLYTILGNAHKLDEEGEDSAENWKKTPDEAVDKLKKSFNLDFPSAELPYPLSHVNLYLGREDSCFSAYLLLFPRNPIFLNDLSNHLENAFKKVGKSFSPTTPYGTGYVMDKLGNIRASIMDYGQEGAARDIGIGCNGARTRKFKDLSGFLKGICELERTANVFLHTAYEPFVKAGMAFYLIPLFI